MTSIKKMRRKQRIVFINRLLARRRLRSASLLVDTLSEATRGEEPMTVDQLMSEIAAGKTVDPDVEDRILGRDPEWVRMLNERKTE